jgi:hypothetical protein
MWMMGCPAGFCDEPAYGEPVPCKRYKKYDGTSFRADGRYDGYVPGLACVGHGGPTKESMLNLCAFCQKEFATCVSEPKFGTGKGNDNIYDCSEYAEGGRP